MQRKCACGGTPGPTGECSACRRKRLGIQPKLTINRPGDKYEREADQVAEQVMRMPEPCLQRQAGLDEEEEEKLLQTKPLVQRQVTGQTHAGIVPPIVQEVLNSPGQPLDSATRSFMEPRFGHDFSRVQVHTDSKAAESARAVDALAYTVGRDVVFAPGQFMPQSRTGKRLLAHELTHVVQQRDAGQPTMRPIELASPASTEEQEANLAAETVFHGEHVSAIRPSGLTLARQGPGASASKTVMVDYVKLDGSNRTPRNDLAEANRIFRPCNVQFAIGSGATATPAQTTAWIGNDRTISTNGDCVNTTMEEQATYAGATTARSRIRAFYVQGIVGMNYDAYSFHPGCGGLMTGFVVVSNAVSGQRELAHELAHFLLNQGNAAHSPDPNNLMADPNPGTQLTPAQCATIYANA